MRIIHSPDCSVDWNFRDVRQTTKGVLQTTRLRLREFTPQDADALALVLSDPETMGFLPRTVRSHRCRAMDRTHPPTLPGRWRRPLGNGVDSAARYRAPERRPENHRRLRHHPAGSRRRAPLRNRIPSAPRLLGTGSRDRSRHRLLGLGIHAPERRSLDFPYSSRESALIPRRRACRYDHLEGSELARPSTLCLFHRESAIISAVNQTHVRVVTVRVVPRLSLVCAGHSPATTKSFPDLYTRSSTFNSAAPPFQAL